MKISTKNLLKRLDNRTEFPIVEPNDKGNIDGCQACGKNYPSEYVMIPERFGAPICFNCVLDIVDAVMTADDKKFTD